MENQREDLRDHLVAALQAAPELPPEERAHLADVFLDELDTRFELVARSGATSWKAGPEDVLRRMTASPGRLILAGAAVWLLVSSLLWTVGPGWHGHHAPFFPILPLLIVLWLARPWRGFGRGTRA
jgi:hypothetical protein